MQSPPPNVVFNPPVVAVAIASTLRLPPGSVTGVMELLSGGNTVPFIARYRKERTGGLDEVQIGAVDDAVATARDLVDRKNRALKSIAEQGALKPDLQQAIIGARDAHEVDDLCRPFKTTRKTRATIARERGLEPLANFLASQVNGGTRRAAVLAPYVDPGKGVADEEAALSGAGDIIAERWAETASTRAWLRGQLSRGFIRTRKKRGYAGDDHRFEQLYDHREPIGRLASHRFLAMRRGETENALSVVVEVDDETIIPALERQWLTNRGFLFRRELEAIVRDCYTRLLKPSVSSEVLTSLREVADQDAIAVFATNLGELLLAPPATHKTILGIDPGFRTGCKVAVIDATGKLVAHTTVYPTAPTNDTTGAERELARLIRAHDVEFIAIGNGTASRETADFCRRFEPTPPGVTTVIVNESGASIYSASAIAREEFPELDLTVRGAISIARRLQDPLAELVKIDPKSIGVGQYQHDVNQAYLKKALGLIGQPSRRGREHRVGPTARLRGRYRSKTGARHRRAPRHQRAVRHAPRAAERPSVWLASIRTVRRRSPRARRAGAPRCVSRAPGKLLRGRAAGVPPGMSIIRPAGRHRCAGDGGPREPRRQSDRAADRARHLVRARGSGPRSARDIRAGAFRGRGALP